MNPDIKLIIFDFFGTLTEELDIVDDCLIPVLNNEPLVRGLPTQQLKNLYKKYRKGLINGIEFWNKLDGQSYLDNKVIRRVHVLPEVMSFIKKVSENHRLVLLSNMPCDWGNHLEHKFGDLFEAFDQIYWSGCYKMIKPEKKIYEMVLSHNDGIRPEEIVYVDDELDDLEGSGGLFGKKVWVNRKNQSEKDLILDVTISEVLDLKNYI